MIVGLATMTDFMVDGLVVNSRITEFKADLLSISPENLMRKSILNGECCIIPSDEYVELRTEVAAHFGLMHNEVLVVGSAKLGFSIAPQKRYRSFSNSSDIDVVLVSSKLFDTFWEEIFIYDNGGAYWKNKQKFIEYMFRGWLRPDKFPSDFADGWFEYFREITNQGKYGPYKIAGALYKNWRFLESYQLDCVIDCKNEIEVA